MRKHVVFAEPYMAGRSAGLDFYYRSRGSAQYLFSYPYHRSIYRYFAYGKSLRQLTERKGWRRNRSLANLVEGPLRKAMRKYLGRDRKAICRSFCTVTEGNGKGDVYA